MKTLLPTRKDKSTQPPDTARAFAKVSARLIEINGATFLARYHEESDRQLVVPLRASKGAIAALRKAWAELDTRYANPPLR